MKYKTVSVGLKRDLRLERFNISQCSAQLSAELNDEDDLEKCYQEVYGDVLIILDEMEALERSKFRKEKQIETSHK